MNPRAAIEAQNARLRKMLFVASFAIAVQWGLIATLMSDRIMGVLLP